MGRSREGLRTVERPAARRAAAGATVLVLAILLGGALPVLGASTTVDLDQWATRDAAWQNGNLNGNNSRYPEGGIVPFRLALEGLKPGNHQIHLNYDFTAGGHKAYDFLATWNVTNAAGRICSKSGGAISSMCGSMPASSSFAFPNDPYVANGLSVHGAEVYSGTPRRLTIWGGTITAVGRARHSGSPNGNSTADVTVKFKATGKAVLLAWGGHLAQSGYWDRSGGGAADGASLVSGAPWHMRTLQLDGSGNKNQDRSIQPSAIVGALPPQGLSPTPRPTPVPTPAAGAPTPRPRTPAPGAPTPGTGGGTPGAPGVPGSTPFPHVTPPATATSEPARPADGGLGAAAGLAVAMVLAALAAIPGRRRRRTRSD
jgi:hypothetical protein